MSVDLVHLRKLCNDTAISILCVDDFDNIDFQLLSNDFFEISKKFINYVSEFHEEFGVDENFIIRAVSYLTFTHAIPPCGNDTSWFSNGLDILFELSYPNTIHTEESSAVMADIEKGIKSSMQNLQPE